MYTSITTNNADGIEVELPACSSYRMNIIGPGTTKGKQCVVSLFSGGNKIVFQLVPLIAVDIGVVQIFPFDLK